jgi:hypothetical protein
MHVEGFRRHLAVDERDRRRAPRGTQDQVRPKLRFGDDEQARIETPQATGHDEGCVERQRHDAMLGIELARRRKTRRRERGDDERHIGVVALEQRDERSQHADLADRGSVEPDAATKRRAESKAETLSEFAPPRATQPV